MPIFRADISLRESVRVRHVIIGALLCVSIASLKKGCTCGEKCRFRHVEADGQPSKKSQKSVVKGSVALSKESKHLGCVSQDSHPRKLVLRKEGKLGSNHTVKFSTGSWLHAKIRDRKGPSRGVIQKCEPHERNPCAPKFAERTQDETLHQESCVRRLAWNLAKSVHKLQEVDKATLYSPIEAGATLAPTPRSPEERAFVVDSGASMHMTSKKVLSSDEMETLRRSRITTTVVPANGEVQTNEEAQVYVHGLDLFVTVQLLDDTPAVLSLGKLCEEHGYIHEWASGQKPHLTNEGTNQFVFWVIHWPRPLG